MGKWLFLWICFCSYGTLFAQNLEQTKYRTGTEDGYDRSVQKPVVKIDGKEEVCQYDTLTFKAVVKGGEEYFYRWWKQGEEEILLSEDSVYRIGQVAYWNKGVYCCEVKDIRGQRIDTATINLVVHKTPVATIVQPVGQDTVLCLNDEIILRGMASLEGVRLAWKSDKGFAAEGANVRTKVVQTAQYVFTADNSGCSTSDTVTLILNSPCVSVPSLINTTEGSTVQVTAKTCDGEVIDPGQLTWYRGATNLGNHNPLLLNNAKSDMYLAVKYTIGSCFTTDTLQFRTKTKAPFIGGKDDGFTVNCIPPILIEQEGIAHETCATLGDSIQLRVVAEGTDITYEWQKFNDYTYKFERVPEMPGVTITGHNSDVLYFTKVTDAASGRYRCVLQNACSDEVISDTFGLSVSGAPIIVSGLEKVEREQCVGEGYADFNVVATAGSQTGSLEYRWYKDGILQSAETDLKERFFRVPLTSTDASGEYKVTVSNLCGIVSDSVDLMVLNPPQIKYYQEEIVTCRGGNAELHVEMQEEGTYFYTLYRVKIVNPVTLEYEVQEVAGSGNTNQINLEGITQDGIYIWEVSHIHCGTTQSGLVYVRVEDVPGIITQPQDTLLCAGNVLELECEVLVGTSFSSLTYQWYKDGFPYGKSSQEGKLVFQSIKAEDAGVYECQVANSCPAVKSARAVVQVKDKPVYLNVKGSELPEYCEGETVRGMEVRLSTRQTVDSMRWFWGNGTPLTEERMKGATTASLVIDGVKAEDGRKGFFLRMYNSCGYTDSYDPEGVIHFDVREPARFVKGLDGKVDLKLCYGKNTTLCVDVTGTPEIRYSWLLNGDTVATGDVACLPVNSSELSETQRYTCHIHNACGSEITETQVRVLRQKIFDVEGGGHYCEGETGVSVELAGSDSSCLYQLRKKETEEAIAELQGTGERLVFDPVLAGSYYITSQDSNRCEQEMQGQVTVVEDSLPVVCLLGVARYPCGEEWTGDLYLKGMQNHTAYYLQYQSGAEWVEMNLSYTSLKGEILMQNVGIGKYRIRAVNLLSGCERIFGEAEIVRQELPKMCMLEFVGGDSAYCQGTESDVKLKLADFCYESGNRYHLWKNGVEYGDEKSALPVEWETLEKGNYQVRIVNSWGCEVVSETKQVYEHDLPAVFDLQGDTLYCGRENEEKQIRLTGSERGVKYSFRYGQEQLYLDTLGNGRELILAVPLVDRTYYGVATDTVSGCEVRMRGEVALQKHTLLVTADPAVVVIHAGEDTVLHINIDGAIGALQINWENGMWLEDPVTQEDPRTKPLWASQLFRVGVEDRFCREEAEVEVTTIGGDLMGEIRLADCEREVDTLKICQGEKVNLCAWASGGGGEYTYRWEDQNGLVSSSRNLQNYMPVTTGWLYLQLTSFNEQVKDSIWIKVGRTPLESSLLNSGLMCLLPEDSLQICLTEGETGVFYQLMYSENGAAYLPVDTLEGKGEKLEFIRKSVREETGYYKITGFINHSAQLKCSQEMEGRIELRQSPLFFQVRGGGNYCAGSEQEQKISVDSSEIGVSYRLVRESDEWNQTLAGHGDTLSFAGNYPEGVYRVIAERGTCRDTMGNEINIIEYPLPEPGILMGNGKHCRSDAPILVGVQQGQANKEYSLIIDTLYGGKDTLFYYGTGELILGNFSQEANYKLEVKDTLTGCRLVKEMMQIMPEPVEVRLEGQGVVCEGATTALVKVKLYAFQDGVTYTLCRLPDMPVAVLNEYVGDTLFYVSELPVGNYVVRAKVGSCEREYKDTIKVVPGEALPLPELNGEHTGCEGEVLMMGTLSSVNGFYYTLNLPDGQSLTLTGDGGPVIFGQYGMPGKYTLVVKESQQKCFREVEAGYHIEPLSAIYTVTGSGEYCAADSTGRQIGLTGSDIGVVYVLQKQVEAGWKNVKEQEGTGTAIVFEGLWAEGTYRVIAGEVCQKEMSGQAVITAIKYAGEWPELKIEGNGCADSSVVLYVPVTTSGYNYALYRDGFVIEGSVKEGNGERQEWAYATIPVGLYGVKTLEGNCRVNIGDSVWIRTTPLLPDIQGDSLICQAGKGRLYLASVTTEANYGLYVLPEDTLSVSGEHVQGEIEFEVHRSGTYQVKVQNGHCRKTGKEFTVRQLEEIPVAEWEADVCTERDNGRILLRNTEADKIYTIESRDRLYTIAGHQGDTLLSGLEVGVYVFVVEDTLSGCRSQIVSDTLYEGVYGDSIRAPWVYCGTEGGFQPELTGVRVGVSYSLAASDGTELSRIERPDRLFPVLLTQGKYLFRKEREGGKCFTEDTVEILEGKMPKTDVPVVLEGSTPVCSGNSYRIGLEAEAGVSYFLYAADKNHFLDTLSSAGVSGRVYFEKEVSEAGRYRVYAQSRDGGCRNRVDTVLTINQRPVIPAYTTCQYCYEGEGAEEGCAVSLSVMQRGIVYTLENETNREIIAGSGPGSFANQTAGLYRLLATDTTTGCADSVELSISRILKPERYALEGRCEVWEDGTNFVRLQDSEQDSVIYRLYRNNVFTGEEQSGTGQAIVFEQLTQTGTYRVLAVKQGSDCGVWMEDSVVLYPALQTCGDTMKVVGSFCEQAVQGGVRLEYPCSVPGWTYYVTNGVYNSEQIPGGRSLVWSSIAVSPIREGDFELYAVNVCGGEVLVAKAKVKALSAPVIYPLVNPDVTYCKGSGFELALAGSDYDTRYRVKRYNSRYELQEQSEWIQGTSLGKLSLGEYAAAGYYEIIALKTNGCETVIQRLDVPEGVLPGEQSILGEDMCVIPGQTGEVKIGIPEREEGVSYYLYVNGTGLADSLTSSYKPAELYFDSQHNFGCYEVIALKEASGCRWKMLGNVCMQSAAQEQSLVHIQDTAEVCVGEKECIAIDNSEAGIRYVLIRDHSVEVKAVAGSPVTGMLEIGCVGEEGSYTVVGEVGECRTPMRGEVYVRLREKPELTVESFWRFCEHTDGIQLGINAPTVPGLLYYLRDTAGVFEDSCQGDVGGNGIVFEKKVNKAGIYVFLVEDDYCIESRQVEVTMENAPDALQLVAEEGNYLCEGAALSLTLRGEVEEDVTYELYRMGWPDYLSTYNFKEQKFRAIREAGTYYVVARSDTGLYCTTDFGALEIQNADTLHHFQVERVKNVYCETDVSKGSIRLSGSEEGVEYELIRDGIATGKKLLGTGSALEWTEVEGKPCSGTANEWEGAVYRIMARDTLTGCLEPMWGSDTIIEASWTMIVGKNLPDLSVCVGDPAELSVTATGCGNTYTWYHWGSVVKSGREPYYNIETIEEADEGTYYCEVVNACGVTAVTNNSFVELRKAVVLRKPMADKRICDGASSVVLSASFENAKRYYWYRPGAEETILKEGQYLPLSLENGNAEGKYVCRAESGDGCGALTDTVEVFIGQSAVVSLTEKQDTFCRASVYRAPELTVAHADSLRWFHNGLPLDYAGTAYKILALKPEDAGLYTVTAYSYKCGDVTKKVATLYVDDTIRLEKEERLLLIGCPGQTQHLLPLLKEEVRVEYRWEENGTRVVGTTDKYLAGPFVENTQHTYRAWCRNSCNTVYQDFVIQVPARISYEEPVRSMILCADGITDTVIRVEINTESLAQVKWYFHPYGDTTQTYTGIEGKEIVVRNTTKSSGYYQGVAYNACQERVALPDTWVKVDSVPVIIQPLKDDTLCLGGAFTLEMETTGGSVNYRWYSLYKDGRLDSLEAYSMEYQSVGRFHFTEVSEAEDSCRIWCRVKNNCGEVWSDTVLIRVAPVLYPQVEGDTFAICAGEELEVPVTLVHGELPWEYRYLTPSGEEKVRAGLMNITDTLKLTEAGDYRIVGISDSRGSCEGRPDTLPVIHLNVKERSHLDFSGGGERCYGDTVSLRLSVEGGTGPWEVTITDGEGEALEVTHAYPLRLYGRDTVLVFRAEKSSFYHISRSVYDVGSGCWGNPTDSVVKVVTHVPEHVNFVSGPWYVGQCRSVRLYDYLQPSINGGLVNEGRFYVEGQPMGTDHLWPQSALRGDSCYRIVYGYTDEFGCEVTSDEIKVCVDSLPSGEIVSSPFACESLAATFDIQLTPAGRIDSVVLRHTRYKEKASGWPASVRCLVVHASDISSDGLLSLPLNWDVVEGADSCQVFEVLNIRDVHGCSMANGAGLKDTIWRHWDPVVEIESRLDSEADWVTGRGAVSIAKGDSVEVRVRLVRGLPSWSLPLQGVYHISGKDTVLRLKEEGHYVFRAEDDFCGRHGLHPWPELEVVYVDTGYFRGRLLLEGPFDGDNGDRMHSSVGDSLGLPSALPLKPSGLEVIDWISLELRSGSPVDSVALLSDSSFVVSVDSCLLLSNGQLADRWSGDTLVGVRDACGGGSNYRYVVVRHRNHLGVMSSQPVRFLRRKELRHGVCGYVDFRRRAAVYCRDGRLTNHMSVYRQGGCELWLLSAGEVNRNDLVTVYDPNHLLKVPEAASHLTLPYDVLYDVNFDGRVEWPGWQGSIGGADWNLVRRNRQKFMEVK